MPDWLDADAQVEWDRVVPDLLKLGLISGLDRQALAQYCEAVSDYRRWTLKIRELNESLVSPDRVMCRHTRREPKTCLSGANCAMTLSDVQTQRGPSSAFRRWPAAPCAP